MPVDEFGNRYGHFYQDLEEGLPLTRNELPRGDRDLDPDEVAGRSPHVPPMDVLTATDREVERGIIRIAGEREAALTTSLPSITIVTAPGGGFVIHNNSGRGGAPWTMLSVTRPASLNSFVRRWGRQAHEVGKARTIGNRLA